MAATEKRLDISFWFNLVEVSVEWRAFTRVREELASRVWYMIEVLL
jgi:hypothetical protein